MICSHPIVKLPTCTASLKMSGSGTPFCRGDTAARKMFWMMTLIAKLANRSVMKLAPRSGRNATAFHEHGRDRRRDDRRRNLHPEGQPCLVLEVDRVRRDGDQLAVGEVDEPEDREHHRQPEGEKRVGRPERERVDDLLDGLLAGVGQERQETPIPR